MLEKSSELSHLSRQEQTGFLLHFRIHDLQCCLHLEHVARVLDLMALRTIPGGPRYLVGLMNLHGKSVPVIDLGIRLGHPRLEKYNLDNCVLLCAHCDERVGLVAAEIIGIDSYQEKHLQMKPVFEEGAPPFRAVVNTEQGLSMLLDLPRLMDIDSSTHYSELLAETKRVTREFPESKA